MTVRRLCDLVSGRGSTASPSPICGSLPFPVYIARPEDLPSGASWSSQPFGLDGYFSNFKEHVNDLKYAPSDSVVLGMGPENQHSW